MPEIIWDANVYDKHHHFVSDYGADVVQWLDPKAGENILDVGCGTGQLAAQIAESGANVLGTDVSAEMVESAQKAYPHLKFEVVNGTELPYNQDFDAIFSNATFHWIENQNALVEGLFKSLKTGGRLVAEFGGKGNVKSITDAIKAAAEQLGFANKVINNFWFFPSISTYSTLLETQGFEVEQVWLFDRPTKLIGEEGMYVWINQFAQHAFKNLTSEQAESIKNLAFEILKPHYFINGEWIADYKRLRVKAWKRA